MPTLTERKDRQVSPDQRTRVRNVAKKEYEHAKNVLDNIPEFKRVAGEDFWTSTHPAPLEFEIGAAKLSVERDEFQSVKRLRIAKIIAINGFVENGECDINTGGSIGMPRKKKYHSTATYGIKIDIKSGRLIGTRRVSGFENRDSEFTGDVLHQFIEDLPRQQIRIVPI